MYKPLALFFIIVGSAMSLSADTTFLTGTTGTASFNPTFFPPTITLGADSCQGEQTTCVLSGTQVLSGLTVTWSFTQPNSSGSPSPINYQYLSGSGTIGVAGDPSLLVFDIHDTDGDDASGTFLPTTLSSSDGGLTVAIDGTLDFNSLTAGSQIALFQSTLGIPSIPPDALGSFELVFGNCTRGSKTGVACVSDTLTDPTGAFISGSIDTPGSVPEPATFGVLGSGFAGLLWARKRHRRSMQKL